MTAATEAMTEFDLIDRLRARLQLLSVDPDTLLGIGDDAAVLRIGSQRLAVAADSMVEGVHFLPDSAAFDLGWKCLAVNLSDLAAMGARPRWALLSLTLPAQDPAWLDCFLDGWAALAGPAGIELVGGDTTRGPLNLAVTVIGELRGAGLRRVDGLDGDDLYVSGSPGEAAAGLALLQGRLERVNEPIQQILTERLYRPTPRLALGLGLADLAHAAIDVSDGLLADLRHLLRASDLQASIDLDCLPTSLALNAAVANAEQLLHFVLNGGDDYELLFSAAPTQRRQIEQLALDCATPVRRIGQLQRGEAGTIRAQGSKRLLQPQGWDHFNLETAVGRGRV